MENEGTIRLARAFCSARDRNVPVLRREAGHPPGSPTSLASDDLPELVSCLDYGVRCTGWLCPLFTLPTLPPEDLLAEAVQTERERKKKTVADGRAILERAVKEGLVRRDRDGREVTDRERSDDPERESPDRTNDGPRGRSAGPPHAS